MSNLTKENQKELAEKWAEALESGEYKQCTGSLESRGKYCCIGVFGDINGLIPSEQAYTKVETIFGKPSKFWYDMNDQDRKSFKQIAKVIRSEYLS